MQPSDPIDGEITAALTLADAMIADYESWNGRRVSGEVMHQLYTDLFEFCNLRVETAQSCVLLIRNGRIADSLGLSRSLLEHFLLFQLMCRGDRYFLLSDPLKGNELKQLAQIEKAKADLAKQHEEGKDTDYLYVSVYPRSRAKRLMWVRKGPMPIDEPGMTVSLHYFKFQDFRPTAMRLDEENYAKDIPADHPMAHDAQEALADHRAASKVDYHTYLSYDALLICLKINDLVDDAQIARVEAHYTFLGQFLHPTHDVARALHQHANTHLGGTRAGLGQRYEKLAVLLASLYTVWLLRSLLLEVIDVVDAANADYFTDSGTSGLRSLVDDVADRFGYFWFVGNQAPLWDRYHHAMLNLSDESLAEYGGWWQTPSSEVMFDSDIYANLKRAFTPWFNTRIGQYVPPGQI